MKIKKISKENELPGNNGNAFSSSKRLYNAISVNEEYVIAAGGLISEGIDFEINEKERGGVIVFSTDVNAVEQSSNKIIDWLKKRCKTAENRINYRKKIDKVAIENELVGWTVGRFLDGRYTAHNGKTFGENSLSVEVVGIDTNKLMKAAEELCNLFTQESVLVKDYTTGRILFINGSR